MKITSAHEQGSGEVNEDVLLIGAGIFGVFDGATSVGSMRPGQGRTGGLAAASIAKEAFARNDAPLRALGVRANEDIRRETTAVMGGLPDRESLWSTSAAVARIDGGELEWFQTGDCRIAAIHRDGSRAALVEPVDHDLETLLLWREVAPTFKGTIFQACRERILKVRRQMNVTYGVLNGEESAPAMFRQGRVELDGIAHLLLYTDGLAVPVRDPRDRNGLDALADLYLENGLEGVRQRVRELERTDPDCRIYPRFKAHDDIAAVAVAF